MVIDKLKTMKIELLIAIAGVLLGISYFYIPLKYVLFGFVALVGIVAVFWKLELGIYASVFMLPFLPTMMTLGLVALIVVSFIFKSLVNKNIKMRFGPLGIWLGIYGALLLLYSLTSVTLASSLKVAAVMLSYIGLYFVIINTVTNKKMLYFLIILLILSGTLESLYGLYQYKIGVPTVDESWTDLSQFPELETRVFGHLDNPNILAQFLEMVIPLGIAMAWSVKSMLKKIIFLGLTTVMALCLVVTFSRGGWIALVLAILTFALLRDRKLILIGVLVGILSIFVLPDFIVSRIQSIGNMGESSISYRTFIWGLGIDIIKDFWYSGVGLGVEAFSYIYNAFYIREGVNAYHTHNLYIQILVETGILGLLSFIAVIVVFVKNALLVFRKNENSFEKNVIAAVLGGLVAFLFHGITENSFYNFKVVYLFWLVLGLAMAIYEAGLKEEKEKNSGESVNRLGIGAY